MTRIRCNKDNKGPINEAKAVRFLKQIRETVPYDEVLFKGFVTTMAQFKRGEINRVSAEREVKELIKDHDNLLFSFDEFFPKKKTKIHHCNGDFLLKKETKIHRCNVDQNIDPLKRAINFLNRARVEVFRGEDQRFFEFINDIENEKNVACFLDSNPELLREYIDIVSDSLHKCFEDLDLSKLDRFGPSYYSLPEGYYPTRPESPRVRLVLNNSLFSSNHEYTSKKVTLRKDDEINLQFDDIKFEFDMLVSYYASALVQAKELLKEINRDNETIRHWNPTDVKQKFSVSSLKCIVRLYGKSVLDELTENPSIVLQVIVRGLKDKEEELRKLHLDFDKVTAPLKAELKNKGSNRLNMSSWLCKTKDIQNIMQKEIDAISPTKY
ncbi:hypothetical protein ACFE04_013315 [Oxalis oulophora]